MERHPRAHIFFFQDFRTPRPGLFLFLYSFFCEKEKSPWPRASVRKAWKKITGELTDILSSSPDFGFPFSFHNLTKSRNGKPKELEHRRRKDVPEGSRERTTSSKGRTGCLAHVSFSSFSFSHILFPTKRLN